MKIKLLCNTVTTSLVKDGNQLIGAKMARLGSFGSDNKKPIIDLTVSSINGSDIEFVAGEYYDVEIKEPTKLTLLEN